MMGYHLCTEILYQTGILSNGAKWPTKGITPYSHLVTKRAVGTGLEHIMGHGPPLNKWGGQSGLLSAQCHVLFIRAYHST